MRISERTLYRVQVTRTTDGAILAKHVVGTALAARRHEAHVRKIIREQGHDWDVETVVDRRPEIGT